MFINASAFRHHSQQSSLFNSNSCVFAVFRTLVDKPLNQIFVIEKERRGDYIGKAVQIRDSNHAMLLAAAVQHQCKVLDLGIAKDVEEGQGKILDNAFASGIDILLTSGGFSMGDRFYQASA